MTETATNTTNGTSAPGSIADALPTDRLKEAAQTLVTRLVGKLGEAALTQVEGLADRLSDVAENGGVGLTSALGGGASALQGESPIKGALSAGAGALKDRVTGALGNVIPGLGGSDDDGDDDGEGGSGGSGGGGAAGARGKFKFMNIFEAQDVGVPLRLAYDQWTQFADFPSFMKKVENVDQSSDEKVTWHAKVFWSKRSWETTIVEQIPDSHILWTSSGQKGRADGIVTFSELAPNLTRIVLIMEYYPQGFFEKTGNIWRAVGRRARLEFKHFCRYVMMDSLVNRDQIEGWRGEIRDSEVVKTHEEALEEERAAEEEDEDYDGEDVYDDEFSDEPSDEELDDDELADEELAADEDDLDDELADDELADDDLEDVADDEDLADDEPDDELDDVADDEEGADRDSRPRRRRGRREPTPA
ncbi:SRPBCC family protein [Actinomycetospora termitidis]|uniref:SRPBCC family protein n=1 Tax=Actinomycetospora termitidis TaxID=3053470 RepID=A0ABT7M8G1_9PSEU|nr:SRPBCC family protein [Actinomycetospora sp. Odt1-22]MDL5156969.1 SRPBCC family protein [Actinomycetospora sp. Odt1-22]